MDSKHFQIVRKSLNSNKTVGEETLASVEILKDRLERVKSLGRAFSKISFSSAVEKLAKQKSPLTVG